MHGRGKGGFGAGEVNDAHSEIMTHLLETGAVQVQAGNPAG